MIKVYFESEGYAEHVATFYSEEMYMSCLHAGRPMALHAPDGFIATKMHIGGVV